MTLQLLTIASIRSNYAYYSMSGGCDEKLSMSSDSIRVSCKQRRSSRSKYIPQKAMPNISVND